MERILEALKNCEAFIDGMVKQGCVPLTRCKLASDIHNQVMEAKCLITKKKGQISDGYHTFDELYEHRITLFIALARKINHHSILPYCFRSKPVDGWFLMLIELEAGLQISYHLPESKWGETNFCVDLELAPYKYEYDGHTSADVLERIKKL